jgi:hypothetical protein
LAAIKTVFIDAKEALHSKGNNACLQCFVRAGYPLVEALKNWELAKAEVNEERSFLLGESSHA